PADGRRQRPDRHHRRLPRPAGMIWQTRAGAVATRPSAGMLMAPHPRRCPMPLAPLLAVLLFSPSGIAPAVPQPQGGGKSLLGQTVLVKNDSVLGRLSPPPGRPDDRTRALHAAAYRVLAEKGVEVMVREADDTP